jgi:hypothetical protein
MMGTMNMQRNTMQRFLCESPPRTLMSFSGSLFMDCRMSEARLEPRARAWGGSWEWERETEAAGGKEEC